MVDSSKRRSLKTFSAIMVGPVVPAIALPVTAYAEATDNTIPLNKVIENEELSISLILSDKPMMRVTNSSDSLRIVRRIHPGVVHAGAKSYDLNHALNSSAYAIGAGRSRLIPIVEAAGISTNDPHYSNINRKPLRLAVISSDNVGGRKLDSSRIFFS